MKSDLFEKIKASYAYSDLAHDDPEYALQYVEDIDSWIKYTFKTEDWDLVDLVQFDEKQWNERQVWVVKILDGINKDVKIIVFPGGSRSTFVDKMYLEGMIRNKQQELDNYKEVVKLIDSIIEYKD